MQKSPTPKRSTGANTLITAAALTLTLSGWAILTVNEAEPTTEIIEPTPTALALSLPPLATLVPTPDWATPNVPVAPPPSAAAPATPRRVVVPPPPAAAAPAAPAQRPKPAAVTRSSR